MTAATPIRLDPPKRVIGAVGQPIDKHIRQVDMVASIAKPPAAWSALRERLDEFLDHDARPLRERLVEAILDGTGDLAALKAAAQGESVAGERTAIVGAVRDAVYPRLLEIFEPAAVKSYAAVAKRFDTAATAFTSAAMAAGDVEIAGEHIVSAAESVRQGWLESQKRAGEVARLMPLLVASAELAGVEVDTERELLPLVLDVEGLHRRRVWEAWQVADAPRCGRWGALVALGAKLRAHPAGQLDEFEAYREPTPLVHRQIPVGGPDGKGITRRISVDLDAPESLGVDIEELVRRAAGQ